MSDLASSHFHQFAARCLPSPCRFGRRLITGASPAVRRHAFAAESAVLAGTFVSSFDRRFVSCSPPVLLCSSPLFKRVLLLLFLSACLFRIIVSQDFRVSLFCFHVSEALLIFFFFIAVSEVASFFFKFAVFLFEILLSASFAAVLLISRGQVLLFVMCFSASSSSQEMRQLTCPPMPRSDGPCCRSPSLSSPAFHLRCCAAHASSPSDFPPAMCLVVLPVVRSRCRQAPFSSPLCRCVPASPCPLPDACLHYFVSPFSLMLPIRHRAASMARLLHSDVLCCSTAAHYLFRSCLSAFSICRCSSFFVASARVRFAFFFFFRSSC